MYCQFLSITLQISFNYNIDSAMGKPSGLKTARKMQTHRRDQRWHDLGYKKAHLGTRWKANPFGGSSHAKGKPFKIADYEWSCVWYHIKELLLCADLFSLQLLSAYLETLAKLKILCYMVRVMHIICVMNQQMYILHSALPELEYLVQVWI